MIQAEPASFMVEFFLFFFGGNDNLKEMRSWVMQQHKTITPLYKKKL